MSRSQDINTNRTIGGLGGNNPILTHPLFTSIAHAHNCSPGVVSFSWAVQRGVTVIPKSGSKSRIEENIRLVTLRDDEMDRINAAHETIARLRIADLIPPLQVEIGGEKTVLGWTKVELGWEDEQGNWLT